MLEKLGTLRLHYLDLIEKVENLHGKLQAPPKVVYATNPNLTNPNPKSETRTQSLSENSELQEILKNIHERLSEIDTIKSKVNKTDIST